MVPGPKVLMLVVGAHKSPRAPCQAGEALRAGEGSLAGDGPHAGERPRPGEGLRRQRPQTHARFLMEEQLQERSPCFHGCQQRLALILVSGSAE